MMLVSSSLKSVFSLILRTVGVMQSVMPVVLICCVFYVFSSSSISAEVVILENVEL